MAEILTAAQAAGGVRADVTVGDLMTLAATVPGAEVDDEARARFVDIVVAGLRRPS